MSGPVLTRLYEPRDFGVMALFGSFAAIAVSFSTAQYHAAIVLPESDDDAWGLTLACAYIATAVSLGVLVVLQVATSLAPQLSRVVIVGLSIYVWTLAVTEAMNHWLMRNNKFRVLAISRLCVVITSTSLTLSLGFWGRWMHEGLILGAVVGQAIPALVVATYVMIGRAGKPKLPFVSVKRVVYRYQKFPKYSLPAELVSTVSYQLPVLLITRFFGPAISGLFALTQRLLGMPLLLVSRAVLDVFKQRASSDYARHGRCDDIFRKTFFFLCAIGIAGFLLLTLIAPTLFAVVFGEKWRTSGEYAQLLAPMFFFRFVASPLSYVLLIAEKQRLDLALQMTLLIASGLSLSLGLYFGSVKIGLAAFSVAYSVLYLTYLAVSYRLSKGRV
ncbi:MAG: oligosaccharide flippase family protein [Gemmatimonadales bacterium]